MTKIDKINYIKERQTLNADNLLNAIIDYSEEVNNSTINWILWDFLDKAFDGEFTEEELHELCDNE